MMTMPFNNTWKPCSLKHCVRHKFAPHQSFFLSQHVPKKNIIRDTRKQQNNIYLPLPIIFSFSRPLSASQNQCSRESLKARKFFKEILNLNHHAIKGKLWGKKSRRILGFSRKPWKKRILMHKPNLLQIWYLYTYYEYILGYELTPTEVKSNIPKTSHSVKSGFHR